MEIGFIGIIHLARRNDLIVHVTQHQGRPVLY
jgi:hypothetical protein